MARLQRKLALREHRIAVVDDDDTYRQSLMTILQREGHKVKGRGTPAEAIELVKQWKPHLLLLDYYMQEGTGADVVGAIREFDQLCQVLLVTGYAAEQPARKLMAELDIQGFHDKSDGPLRLLVLVDAALKHHRSLERVRRQRKYLDHILDVSAEITRLQPVEELFYVALSNLGPLLQGMDGFIATTNNGIFVMDGAGEGISIRASMGRFERIKTISKLNPEIQELVRRAIETKVPTAHEMGLVSVPMETRDGDRGCMVVVADGLPQDAVEACSIYAAQVVQALENITLYEQATVDVVSGTHTRAFGLRQLEESLRLGSRIGQTTSVVMMDLDQLKIINDSHGHAAGDLVLRAVGRAIADNCRLSDSVARYGGDEFFLVLPATNVEGAVVFGDRLRQRIANLEVAFEGQTLRITASMGVASSTDGKLDADSLLRNADEALYQAKASGRNTLCVYESEQ